MNRYKILEELGGGSYGVVYKAQLMATGEVVAIKKMRRQFGTWEECLALREVSSLSKLKHENIVRLRELVHEPETGMLCFVFEFVPSNLFLAIKDSPGGKPLAEARIRNIMRQLLLGLQHMHKHGFFHRDIKPENLLLGDRDSIKIADFGLARETRSRPPYTEYVSTRWYRAPELLLRTARYNSPIDMWAAGCIMAEMYLRKPLFAGTSEVHQVQCICQKLGTPSASEWPEGIRAARNMNFRFPKCSAVSLESLMPGASRDAMALMKDLLKYDSYKRPSASVALGYAFFSEGSPRGESKSSARRNSLGLTPVSSAEVDEEVLTPAQESPSVRCTLWPRDRSSSFDKGSSGRFDTAGAPRTRTLRPMNSFRRRDGSDGAGAGGAGAGGSGAGSGSGAPRSGPASKAGSALKTDVSLDASAMEDLLDELEMEVLGKSSRTK